MITSRPERSAAQAPLVAGKIMVNPLFCANLAWVLTVPYLGVGFNLPRDRQVHLDTIYTARVQRGGNSPARKS
jgi:hypothetical protein